MPHQSLAKYKNLVKAEYVRAVHLLLDSAKNQVTVITSMSFLKAKKSLDKEIGLNSMMLSANIRPCHLDIIRKVNWSRIDLGDLTGNHEEQDPLRTTLWK